MAPNRSKNRILDENSLVLHRQMIEKNNEALQFFTAYQYKLEESYQANNAILLSTFLYASVQQSMKENTSPERDILRIISTGEELNLSELAQKICTATGKTARTVQFIAIGVSASGDSWVTTNYHAPVIYPLSYFLSQSKYSEAERLRSRYKISHRQSDGSALTFATGDKTIHAETMMASLKSLLDIQRIFFIDGSGKKIENCQFCSHYLNHSGFSSEPHMESIQNYAVPTLSQQEACVDFGLSLQNKEDTNVYQWIDLNEENLVLCQEAMNLSRDLLTQAFKLIPYDQPRSDTAKLEQIFIAIKKYYPFTLDEQEGLKETYHLSRKLAYPDTKELSRTVVRKTVSTKRHPNLKIKFFDDNRLELDPSGNRLKPAEPTSPRSKALSKYANDWLKKGDPSVRFVQQQREDVIELKR